MKKYPIRLLIFVALLSSAATIVALRWNIAPGDHRTEAPAPAFAATPAAGPVTLSSDEEVNIRVYNSVSPGVVNITKRVLTYDFFFTPVAQEGTGSGCVLDKEGTILTNYHVIESANNLEVSLPDHTKHYHAKVVGYDERNDLAVIRLDGAPKEWLHPIRFGDSSVLKVGQKVLAVGNPFGLQNTLTIGIISSLGRRLRTESDYIVDNVIQTDAAINPGNSGGPLLNTAGEMIGINSAIFTGSSGGGNIGIGFAIPTNTIRQVVADLIREGRVRHPWFGVQGYELDDDLASELRLPVNSGIMVFRVYRGSSAEKADIRGATEMAILFNQRYPIGGDIITAVDGKAVSSLDDLRLLEMKRPGEVVEITIYRGRSKMAKSVTLIEAPRQPAGRN